MEEKNIEMIKELTKDFILKMGFDAEIESIKTDQEEEECLIVNIKVRDDSNLLIGQYGANLQPIQHILRLIARKKISDEKLKFTIDVNSYRQQKNESLLEMARSAAEEAISEGRTIVLRPMSAYERRLIHIELSKNEKVVTESMGEEENRKVVIKPSSMKM